MTMRRWMVCAARYRSCILVLASSALAACGEGTTQRTLGAETAPSGELNSSTPVTAPDSAAGILFVGTSLTAGYGLESVDKAYPALIQQKLDSAGYRFKVINAGVSGETSAGGLNKIDWILSRPFRVLVLELGANDGLRGLSPAAMRSNLEQIIQRARARYPDIHIVIAGMEAPPNYGPLYTRQFRDAFRDLAKEYDAALIPFLLDGVAGSRELNQNDGIHPSEEGQRLVANNVWKILEPVVARVVKATTS
jgi:acyl-CoA thioesterase-1